MEGYKSMTNWRRQISLLALIVMAVTLVLPISASAEWSDNGNSLTISYVESAKTAYPKLIEVETEIKLYKLASMDEKGTISVLAAFSKVEGLKDIWKIWDEGDATAIETLTQNAFNQINEKSVADIETKIEAKETEVSLEKVGAGIYLIVPATTINGAYSYSFNPSIAFVPELYYGLNEKYEWEAAQAVLKPEEHTDNGSFEIIKTLKNWHETQGSVTFIYKVTGVLSDGLNDTIVLDNVYSIAFSDGAGEQKITIGNLPTQTKITVEEIYDGKSYIAEGDTIGETVIEPDGEDDEGKTVINSTPVEFTNKYDDGLIPGHGILNKYTAQKNEDGTFSGTWEAKQVKDSTEMATELQSVA